MVFVQIEVFIFFGNWLFAKLNFDRSPGEITRIILARLMIFLAACLMASMILFILVQYAGLWMKGEDLSKVIYNFIHFELHGWFKSTITGLSAGAIIFIILLWQSSLRREQKLREENLIFQNETLKNQVNPHFLFNSLNTISSLVQTQPEAAEQFINDLSSIYRYILENGQKNKVPLQSELDFITGYYNLHKIRDEKKIMLNVDARDAGEFEILPVSLQILLENAIKHNIATRENPLRISIYIEDQFIVVKNNLQKKATQLKSTKIGLKNLEERVRLISGRDLIIEETKNYFIVKVPLLK
jgi:LytS/YehU family sensor histidine kinase